MTRDRDMQTPLIWAVKTNRLHLLRIMIGKDCSKKVLDAMAPRLRTALHAAVREGSIEAITLLLDAGADINIEDWDDETALSIATYKGSHDIVRLLLSRGAHVNVTLQKPGLLLYRACWEENITMVRSLLEAGANVDADVSSLNLALKRSLDIAKLLIDAGADVNAENGKPLNNALKYSQFPEAVDMLLKAGARPELVSKDCIAGLREAFIEGDDDRFFFKQCEAKIQILQRHGLKLLFGP